MNNMTEINELENMKTEMKNVSTTGFVNDMPTDTESPDNQGQINNIYFSKSSAVTDHTVTRFLAKPVEITTGQFAIGDTVATFPTQYRVPYALINNEICWPKLQGYYGFRATMVLTLQVNAQRFQQGRYMLVYVPSGGTVSDAKATEWFNTHAATITSRTQCPHVEIDINKQTSVELRIPFNSSHDLYPLQYNTDSTSSKWGVFQIFPYVALNTGSGSTTAKFTLWGHLEDVELVGQALPLERQSNSLKEAKSKDAGPIESTSLKIKKAAGILSNVPIISSYVKPVEWVADLVAKTANVFGWSSPANLDKQYRVETTMFSYATNVDKVDKTFPLSHSVKNSVQALPGESMDNADELHISHIASRFAYQRQFNWSDTDGEEALLDTILVGLYPNGSPVTHVQGATILTDFTPAQWVGSRFEMYRGSIKLRFKVVKTDFHSGRLSFDFNPEARDYVSPAMLDTVSPFLHRQIIDIRDISEFTLEFPFISHNPYLGTYMNGITHFGRLEVRVIDPLVAPATVSSTVTLLVEHAMCDDVEFAGRNLVKRQMPASIEVQSNSMVMGDALITGEQYDTSVLSIGEKITNMRAMLKRYEPIAYASDAQGTHGVDYRPFNWGKVHCVVPFAGIRDSTAVDDLLPDLYSEMSAIYLYSRGSVRLKMRPSSGLAFQNSSPIEDTIGQNFYVVLGSANAIINQIRSVLAIGIGPFAASTPTPNVWDGALQNTNYGNFSVIQANRDRAIEVQVPQWLRQHSRNNAVHQCNTASPYRTTNVDEVSKSFIYVYSSASVGTQFDQTPSFCLDVWRAGADDCNFSGFISVPPMELFQHGQMA